MSTKTTTTLAMTLAPRTSRATGAARPRGGARRQRTRARILATTCWLALAGAGALTAAPPLCTVGTKAPAACSLQLSALQGPVDAEIALPSGFTGMLSASSTSTYDGSASCPDRFMVRVSGDGQWTRLSVRPRTAPSTWDQCTCANMVAELHVIALAKHSYCEGGCADCSIAEFCADPGNCFQCSFTPLGLVSWPTERVKAVGVWVTASPLGGPAHCELRASAYRDTSSPAWSGKGGVVAAVVWDRRTGAKLPVIVEARNSANDPEIVNGGCPACGE